MKFNPCDSISVFIIRYVEFPIKLMNSIEKLNKFESFSLNSGNLERKIVIEKIYNI